MSHESKKSKRAKTKLEETALQDHKTQKAPNAPHYKQRSKSTTQTNSSNNNNNTANQSIQHSDSQTKKKEPGSATKWELRAALIEEAKTVVNQWNAFVSTETEHLQTEIDELRPKTKIQNLAASHVIAIQNSISQHEKRLNLLRGGKDIQIVQEICRLLEELQQGFSKNNPIVIDNSNLTRFSKKRFREEQQDTQCDRNNTEEEEGYHDNQLEYETENNNNCSSQSFIYSSKTMIKKEESTALINDKYNNNTKYNTTENESFDFQSANTSGTTYPNHPFAWLNLYMGTISMLESSPLIQAFLEKVLKAPLEIWESEPPHVVAIEDCETNVKLEIAEQAQLEKESKEGVGIKVPANSAKSKEAVAQSLNRCPIHNTPLWLHPDDSILSCTEQCGYFQPYVDHSADSTQAEESTGSKDAQMLKLIYLFKPYVDDKQKLKSGGSKNLKDLPEAVQYINKQLERTRPRLEQGEYKVSITEILKILKKDKSKSVRFGRCHMEIASAINVEPIPVMTEDEERLFMRLMLILREPLQTLKPPETNFHAPFSFIKICQILAVKYSKQFLRFIKWIEKLNHPGRLARQDMYWFNLASTTGLPVIFGQDTLNDESLAELRRRYKITTAID